MLEMKGVADFMDGFLGEPIMDDPAVTRREKMLCQPMDGENRDSATQLRFTVYICQDRDKQIPVCNRKGPNRCFREKQCQTTEDFG